MNIKHKLFPVSYIDADSKQVNALYSFNPKGVAPSYWVGEPITVEVEHPDGMADDHRIARILELKEKLAKLEKGNG